MQKDITNVRKCKKCKKCYKNQLNVNVIYIENVHVENQATDDFNVKNQAADLIAMLAILMRFAPRHI